MSFSAMRAIGRSVYRSLLDVNSIDIFPSRLSNTLPNVTLEKHRRSPLSATEEPKIEQHPQLQEARDFRFVYPDFLPDPQWTMRDRVREILERRDMYKRRVHLEVPEFYVGSILAVTVSDPYAPGRINRFLGLCIQREGHGLRHNFTLRNCIDGQGIEIRYDLYNPTIQKIEVIKLERRLDDELFYLRDCDLIHSTFPLNMEPVILPPGAPVPVNTTQVKLKPWPWSVRWELHKYFNGIVPLTEADMPPKRWKRSLNPQNVKEWEKHDLMKQYRSNINEVEERQVASEVVGEMRTIDSQRLQQQRDRLKAAKPAAAAPTAKKS